MPLDELLRNPALRKAVEAGEQKVGEVVGKLLANERFASGLRSLVSSALHARHGLEKGVSRVLRAARLPSREDVADLERRLAQLEAEIDVLASRVAREGKNGGA